MNERKEPAKNKTPLTMKVDGIWPNITISFFRKQKVLFRHIDDHFCNPNEDWKGMAENLNVSIPGNPYESDGNQESFVTAYRDCTEMIHWKMTGKEQWWFSFRDREKGNMECAMAISPFCHYVIHSRNNLITSYRDTFHEIKEWEVPVLPFKNGCVDWGVLKSMEALQREILEFWLFKKFLRKVRFRLKMSLPNKEPKGIPSQRQYTEVHMTECMTNLLAHSRNCREQWLKAKQTMLEERRETINEPQS